MPVITISRQFGAGSGAIGRELAARFGAELLDRQLVAMVAARCGIPESEAEGYDERIPSLWQRIAAALATSAPEVAMPPLPEDAIPATAMHERLASITRAVIEEAAERGNAVIMGRGGAFILGDRPDTVHIQLHAPFEVRMQHLLDRVEEMPPDTRPDEASLRELCDSVDRARGGYIRRLFNVDWLAVTHYDLALDVGRLGIARTVDLVEQVVREMIDSNAETSTQAI